MSRRRPVPNLRNLDAEAITAMLSRRHADVSVEHVQILERARCGDGIASTADRVALRRGTTVPGTTPACRREWC